MSSTRRQHQEHFDFRVVMMTTMIIEDVTRLKVHQLDEKKRHVCCSSFPRVRRQQMMCGFQDMASVCSGVPLEASSRAHDVSTGVPLISSETQSLLTTHEYQCSAICSNTRDNSCCFQPPLHPPYPTFTKAIGSWATRPPHLLAQRKQLCRWEKKR